MITLMKVQVPRAWGIGAGLVAVLLTGLACRGTDGERVQEFVASPDAAEATWEATFDGGKRIEIRFPELEKKILSIGHVSLDSQGRLVLPDGRNHRVLVIDPVESKLVHKIGSPGRGPGEVSVMGPVMVDDQDNILIYDVDGRRIGIFDAPDYEYSGSFSLPSSATLILPLSRDDLIVYSPADQAVIKKFDREGALAAQVLEPQDHRLRLFLGRFHTGGIVASDKGEGFFAIYPEEFSIYHFSQDLDLLATLKSNERSRWRPDSPPFPRSLSPYSFSPTHQEWWDSFLHVARIFSLDAETVAVTLFKSKGQAAERNYLNIYQTDGTVVAEGLEVPYGGQVVAAGRGKLYITTVAYLTEAGVVVPAELWEYQYTATQPSQVRMASAE